MKKFSKNKFKLADGVKVCDLKGIKEGFLITEEKDYTKFTINISIENLEDVFFNLAKLVEPPTFLIIEIPTNIGDEKELRPGIVDLFHRDVFYLDNIEFGALKEIFERYKYLFIHDGMITYGFGSHKGPDEIYVGKYKIFSIYTANKAKYIKVLNNLNFKEYSKLKTVWSNFSEDTPGCLEQLEFNNKSSYDVVEELKEEGLFFYKRIVDPHQ